MRSWQNFLFGWMRGYQKSLTRLIIVLVVAVVAFFVTPLLTNAVLTMDISGLNIRINGDLITNVKDYIITFLKSMTEVREAIEASPTLEAFITALPAMIVNTFLFTLIFFILKWISMAIYAIFAFTVFSKKKMESKNKIKLLGAGIGVVQALVALLVLLVPVFGYVAIAGNMAESVSEVSTTSVAYQTSIGAEDTATTPRINLEDAQAYATKYSDAFNNTWIVKVYRVIGADKLSIAVFNELSKQKVNDIETNLSNEMNTAAELIPVAVNLTKESTIRINGTLIENAEHALDVVYGKEGKEKQTVLGEIINEVVKYTAQKFANGE